MSNRLTNETIIELEIFTSRYEETKFEVRNKRNISRDLS